MLRHAQFLQPAIHPVVRRTGNHRARRISLGAQFPQPLHHSVHRPFVGEIRHDFLLPPRIQIMPIEGQPVSSSRWVFGDQVAKSEPMQRV